MSTLSSNKQIELIDRIYNMYAEDLKRYFLSYTHNMMAAEDMTHDLFLKIMNVDYIMEHTAQHLLFVTAKRMVIDDARHKAYIHEFERKASAEIEITTHQSTEKEIDHQHIIRLEAHHLTTFPKKSAEVYQLYFHDEQSAKEIARQMGMNLRTVEGHIYRTRKDMRKYLKKII